MDIQTLNNAGHNDSTDELSMSSLEIAELTGKRHDHVIRDIRKMLNELDKPHSPHFWGERKDSTGRTLAYAILDYHHTMCLVTGYKAKLRMAVIERLDALERGEATPWHEQDEPEPEFQIPQTYADEVEQDGDAGLPTPPEHRSRPGGTRTRDLTLS